MLALLVGVALVSFLLGARFGTLRTVSRAFYSGVHAREIQNLARKPRCTMTRIEGGFFTGRQTFILTECNDQDEPSHDRRR